MPVTTDIALTRLVFADQLAPGMVILKPCRQPPCMQQVTSHNPGGEHQLTVLDIRTGDRGWGAIVVDEDGNQQSLQGSMTEPVRIRTEA